MSIGPLPHRVKLEARSATQDALGGQATAWQVVDAVWARVRPLTARELLAAQAVQSDVTHEVKIRYRADVTAKLRVRFGLRLFNITGVINTDEANVEMRLLCTEGLADG